MINSFTESSSSFIAATTLHGSGFVTFHGGKFIDRKGYEKLEDDSNDMYDDVNFDSVIKFTGLNLEILLKTINKRIEKLIDKDHQIGHSYFINISTIEELKSTFKNKIIPLLQEYFFGDQGKIGLIIGPAFFEGLEAIEENIFVDFAEYDVSGFSERKIYKMKNILEMSNDDFNNAINILLKK